MTDTAQEHKPTLVLGGTGKSGRRVVERLRARGLPVRVGSRSGEPPFDWEYRSTWAPALDGVGAVYLTYYPDLAVPGPVDATRSFAEVALRSGVFGRRRHRRHRGRRADRRQPRGAALRADRTALADHGQIAAEISEAAGREVRYVPVSLEQHATEAAEHGVPPEFVELLTYLFAEVVDGRTPRVDGHP